MDVPGYEGLYQVSNFGQVRSLDRMVNAKNDSKMLKKGIILKPRINEKGYQRVHLCKDGKGKQFRVHRLVYEAFCGEIPSGMEVNHINEVKTDNRLENLNLLSRKDNVNWGTGMERGAKSRINHPKRSKPVVGYDADENVVIAFPSTMEAQRHGYSSGNISACCIGKKPQYKGLIWRYANGTS